MAIMNYETPNITKIEFEDNLFVTTEFDSYDNKEIKGYIESQGGIVKNSVTKSTNYLLYEDGKEETTKYKKALELVQEKGLDIAILSRKKFKELVTMHYETPDVTLIEIEDNIFVTTEFDSYDNKIIKDYIESQGGVVKNSVTKSTSYLLYEEGKYQTTKYKRALELVQENGTDIKMLSRETFEKLITMTYETPNISEIAFAGKQFVFTAIKQSEAEDLRRFIEKYGGSVNESITETTDYLIYKDDGYKDDGWITDEYRKALAISEADESRIVVLPISSFIWLVHRKCDIEFGSYPTEEDGSRKAIQWSILKQDGNKALLLAVNGLNAKPYNTKFESVTWETCTLRKWLNEDFYNTAFSSKEQKRILVTKNENKDNPRFKTAGGNDTEDKVFLLSIEEAETYLTRFERMIALTSYAVKQGIYTSYGKCWWWLRSPGHGSYLAAYVFHYGYILDDGYGVNNDRGAVCPALWIDLESEI